MALATVYSKADNPLLFIHCVLLLPLCGGILVLFCDAVLNILSSRELISLLQSCSNGHVAVLFASSRCGTCVWHFLVIHVPTCYFLIFDLCISHQVYLFNEF